MLKENSAFAYVLSSKSKMNLDEFNTIFYTACGVDDSTDVEFVNSKQQTIQSLSALGFCEFDFLNRAVYMCPPSLVSVPSFGLPSAILTGARSPGLINRLKAAVLARRDKVEVLMQANPGNMPDLIKIDSLDLETLVEIADECGISHRIGAPVACDLASLSCSLDDVRAVLKFRKKPELQSFERRTFSASRLDFLKSLEASEHSYRLVEYKPPYGSRLYWIWDGEQEAEVGREFGQYLVLNRENQNVLLYDGKSNKMGVPIKVPMPTLLARAVALCSGVMPLKSMNPLDREGSPAKHFIFEYPNVPKAIAMMVAEKLGQHLQYVSF